jgi:hypothetical protein
MDARAKASTATATAYPTAWFVLRWPNSGSSMGVARAFPSIHNLDLARGLNAEVSGDATFRAAFDRLYKVEHDLDRASPHLLWLCFLFKHLGLFGGCKWPLHRDSGREPSRRQPRKLSRAR